jgi:hypothetical protein
VHAGEVAPSVSDRGADGRSRARIRLRFGEARIRCVARRLRAGRGTDDKVVAAAAFAIDAKRKETLAAREPAALTLVAIQRAEQQVVAGINYRLEIRVMQNDTERTAVAVVWWQAWRTPDAYRLTSWQWM